MPGHHCVACPSLWGTLTLLRGQILAVPVRVGDGTQLSNARDCLPAAARLPLGRKTQGPFKPSSWPVPRHHFRCGFCLLFGVYSEVVLRVAGDLGGIAGDHVAPLLAPR